MKNANVCVFVFQISLGHGKNETGKNNHKNIMFYFSRNIRETFFRLNFDIYSKCAEALIWKCLKFNSVVTKNIKIGKT